MKGRKLKFRKTLSLEQALSFSFSGDDNLEVPYQSLSSGIQSRERTLFCFATFDNSGTDSRRERLFVTRYDIEGEVTKGVETIHHKDNETEAGRGRTTSTLDSVDEFGSAVR